MCDFSKNAIAWLDHELPPQEAASFECHVRICAECQKEVELFGQLNKTFAAYCEAAMASKPALRKKIRVWSRVVPTTAALAAAAVLLLFLFKPVERLPQIPARSNGLPTSALEEALTLIPSGGKTGLETSVDERARGAKSQRHLKNSQGLGRSRSLVKPPVRSERNLPNQTPVYVAIPADALFPPGAFPEGVGFVADVNWRSDGSTQWLRLQPQLVGFQRRETQP